MISKSADVLINILRLLQGSSFGLRFKLSEDADKNGFQKSCNLTSIKKDNSIVYGIKTLSEAADKHRREVLTGKLFPLCLFKFVKRAGQQIELG
jgi:hypothetical protein